MLKLISLNMETNKHYATIVPFLIKENADVVCLQEAPDTFQEQLRELGYHTSFASQWKEQSADGILTIGVLLASKIPHQSKTVYYYNADMETPLHDKNNKAATTRGVYLIANIGLEDQLYTVATTHLIVTKNGLADSPQTAAFTTLQNALQDELPHVICGDFNMPRGYNSLYEKMLLTHLDTIPNTYSSSLDSDLHRLGNLPEKSVLFEHFMVDYIFTQVPYTAHDVRLQFGVSDHAAVVGYIEKATPPSHS